MFPICETCGEELTNEFDAGDGWCVWCSAEDDARDDNYSDARDDDWDYSEHDCY